MRLVSPSRAARSPIVAAFAVAVVAATALSASAWSPGGIGPGPGDPVTDAGARAGVGATDAGAPGVSSPIARPSPSPSTTHGPLVEPSPVPLVPVVSFWDSRRTVSLRYLADAISGTALIEPSQPLPPVAVGGADATALSALLRVPLRNVRAMPPAAVAAYVRTTPGALGILRAADVTLGVRALAVDGAALFGIGHIGELADWPLLVNEPGVASDFTIGSTWTIAAGGDVMLDKAVYAQSILGGKGVDYAWNGATAVVDRHYCCGWGGGYLAAGHSFGGPGQVADLFRAADVSAVNLESPEPRDFRYHSTGFKFTGDPVLLEGLADAGIDIVSLANNHLGDGGLHAVADETATLDSLGIAHAGAGANLTAARRAAVLEAGGLTIAVLAYCWIDPIDYWATASSPGSSGYNVRQIVADIVNAKRAGADYVVVMPHWGIEYTDYVDPQQRQDAERMVAAGADLILGSHSHWFGQVQQLGDDHLVFYSLGDLVFDWTHDERAQESAIADLTFVGRRLVQVDLHPTLIIAGQPNLLDPSGDGRRLYEQMKADSGPYLGW
jgi:hypothetical protein